jgi:thiosulfate reductase cytochrome b subunit
MVCMIMSGWQIYNASPLFAFRVPNWATLGGWLGGAIAWHLACMWLLVGNGIVYFGYGLISGHFRRNLLPFWPNEILRDARDAARLRLRHRSGEYNAVQRLAYVAVFTLGVLAIASGLCVVEAGAAGRSDDSVRWLRRAAYPFRRYGGHRPIHSAHLFWCSWFRALCRAW